MMVMTVSIMYVIHLSFMTTLQLTIKSPDWAPTHCCSHRLVYIYIGADFKGYISQVTVWGRMMSLRTEALSMYSDPFNPSSTDLLARWSGYQLSDNLWARVIHPSIAKTSEMVCDNGQPGPDACSASGQLGITLCPFSFVGVALVMSIVFFATGELSGMKMSLIAIYMSSWISQVLSELQTGPLPKLPATLVNSSYS